MAFEVFSAITMNISRVLEALFDEIEYRLARRELRHASKVKTTGFYRSRVLPDEVMTTKAISVKAA